MKITILDKYYALKITSGSSFLIFPYFNDGDEVKRDIFAGSVLLSLEAITTLRNFLDTLEADDV